MPAPTPLETKQCIRKCPRFNAVYLAMLLLSLHWAIVTYVNSTYLSEFISNAAVGTLYTIGSALTILSFLFISRVLRKLGNYTLTLTLIGIEMVALIGMGMSDSLRVVVPLFVLHHMIAPLLLFNIDVFMESLIGPAEGSTGGKRGILLTIMSLAGAVAPLAAGLLIGNQIPRFEIVYFASAFILLPLIYVLVSNFKTFTDPPYTDIEVLSTIHSFWEVRDLRFVFLSHFLLQLFFAWMVIYMPLYLATVIGFGWGDIGIILFAGLMAYVFLEYPIGRLADGYIGEKEMMIIGFVILIVSTSYLSFITTLAIIPWIVITFLTRVGASLVEATTESYFFKHTNGSDASIISFFRITRPLAILFGALFGSLALLYMPFGYLFLALGIILIPGVFFSLLLKDTR